RPIRTKASTKRPTTPKNNKQETQNKIVYITQNHTTNTKTKKSFDINVFVIKMLTLTMRQPTTTPTPQPENKNTLWGCGLFIGHYRLKPLDDAPQSLNHRT
ncbi:hypothetical protein QP330_09920, partial [Actinotignum timonense]|uniref:hypothetical protein n=1 Tax=Actinotignum timonense TaxID=1870995 RepID=UPI00254F6885|nr:hypothetical protein [Actinotignum timonense]